MSATKTAEGRGPLPKKPPRWRVVRRKPVSVVATAIDKAVANDARLGAIMAWPTGEAWQGFVERLRATLAKPVAQGANLRPAGLNVPTGERKDKLGNVRAVIYPFGVRRMPKPGVQIILKMRVAL